MLSKTSTVHSLANTTLANCTGYVHVDQMQLRSSGQLIPDECGFLRSLRFNREHRDWIWITRVSLPLYLFVCTVGNVLALIRVCRDRKGPKRTFLMAMFITDLCFMWNKLIIQVGAGTWYITEPRGLTVYGRFYKQTAGIWLYLESILFFTSQWALMAFCVDRFLAIRFPIHHHTNYRRHSLLAVAFIFACSVINALYIPVVYYWILTNNMLEPGAIIPDFPKLLRHWRRIEMWWEVLERLLAYGGTATLNMLIIMQLHRTRIRVARIPIKVADKPATIIHHHPTVRRTSSNHAAKKILITSSFFFLFTQSLDFGMSLLLTVSQAPICLFHVTNAFMQVYDPFRWLLVNMYFAGGFVFYLCCGERSWRTIFMPRRKRVSVVESLPLTEVVNISSITSL